MDASQEETRDEEEEMPVVLVSNTPTTTRNSERSCQNQLTVYLILMSLLLERMAFYSIAANLTVGLGQGSPLQWSDKNIIIAEFIFTGVAYFSTLIFAVISDAKLGRAKTILLGFSIYTIGFIPAILITHPKTHHCICGNQTETNDPQKPCFVAILITIVIIALGAGAVQSNMAVLGAEQIQRPNRRSRYFDKYIMAVNIGGATARLSFSAVQLNKNFMYFYVVYIVAIGAIILATILFLIGWRRYRHVKPYDSVITKCIPVFSNAYQTRNQCKKNKRSLSRSEAKFSTLNSVNSMQGVHEEKEFNGINEEPLSFLDFAKVLNGGRFNERIVNDVKSLRKAMPVFGFFIPFFIVYNQINSSFPLQGRHMDTSGDPSRVTWVSIADPVTIIMGILMLHMFVYKCWDAQNKRVSIATKIVIGMIFACIAMFLAGSVEIARQKGCNHLNNSSNTSSLSVYAQIPQYTSMGLFEIFAMVASYEFAYYAAPRSARSLFMSLRFFLLGVLSSITAACVYFFPKQNDASVSCPADKSWQWGFYTYFFILAGFQLLFIFIFIRRQKKSHIIKLHFEN